jgi:hypothetical protein
VPPSRATDETACTTPAWHRRCAARGGIDGDALRAGADREVRGARAERAVLADIDALAGRFTTRTVAVLVGSVGS